MKLKNLASEIAKREGKKSQARIGDIREIIGILSDIYYETAATPGGGSQHLISRELYANGKARAKKAGKPEPEAPAAPHTNYREHEEKK